MESIYLGLETFEELEELLKAGKTMLERFPEDFGLEVNQESLEHFKESALLELKRRARDEHDPRAIEVLEQLERKSTSR